MYLVVTSMCIIYVYIVTSMQIIYVYIDYSD